MYPIETYTLANQTGSSISILNYGAIISQWHVPLLNGGFQNIVLGYEAPEHYLNDNVLMGAMVGRVANRIDAGKFILAGKAYQLECNLPPHHLHGGSGGFHKKWWALESHSKQSLMLSLLSEDGDQGYDGNMKILLSFTLADDHSLSMTIHGKTDALTLINPTQHSYFNLDGSLHIGESHRFRFSASQYLEKRADAIPTGKAIQCADDPIFDFRKERSIEYVLANLSAHRELLEAKGFDHHFIVEGDQLRHFAEISSMTSHLRMNIYSDAPGFQLYMGNHLTAGTEQRFHDYQAFCIEPQAAPDAINNQFKEEVIFAPHQSFVRQIIYQLSRD